MLCNRGLAYAKFTGDEQAANSVFHQISVALRREMTSRMLQPFQNLQPPVIAKSLNGYRQVHLID